MFFDFNYYKSLSKELQKELEVSRASFNTQLEATKALNLEIENYKNLVEAFTEGSVVGDNFEIDFKKLNAFSIERVLPINQNTNFNVLPIQFHENTAIGYLVEGEVKEWYFSCDMSTHQRLVLEFKAYRNGG